MQYGQKAIQMQQYRTAPATITTTINMFLQLMNNSASDHFLYQSAFQQLKGYKRRSGKKITLKTEFVTN
jgi:hypothetical protein